MSSTTRWEFDSNLGTLSNLRTRIGKNKQTSNRIKNLHVVLSNSLNGKPLLIKFNRNDIKFYVYKIAYTKVIPGERINYNNKFMILYENKLNDKVYVIINKNTGAKTLLRYIFNISGPNKMLPVGNQINNKLIMWLIILVYYKKPVQNDIKNGLKITSMSGFSGNIPNTDTTVSINGDDIINLLSSLSFILESNDMKRIILWISYKHHKHIEISLAINNTIEIKEYAGKFRMQKFAVKYGKNCYLFLSYLMVYCEILPLLSKLFKKSQFYNQKDSKEIRIRFLNNIVHKIENRVNDKAKDIKHE